MDDRALTVAISPGPRVPGHRFSPSDLVLVLPGVLLALNVLLFGTISIYNGNSSEFLIPFGTIFLTQLAAPLLLVVVALS